MVSGGLLVCPKLFCVIQHRHTDTFGLWGGGGGGWPSQFFFWPSHLGRGGGSGHHIWTWVGGDLLV